MAMNIEGIERMEQGVPESSSPKEIQKRTVKWWLIALNCILMGVGTICGPMLLRLYYLHGGSRKWLTSSLQTAGFPILLIPLSIVYMRERARGMKFLLEPKLFISSVVIGLLMGLDNFMYSVGSSFLPVSTSSLLFATQLAFTAFFAFIIVKQKFTAYTINAVVLMTLGSVLLGLRNSGDRPANVTNGQYLLGFIMTLGASALLGFAYPCIELSYAKAKKVITYPVVMQFQFCTTMSATIFCVIGMTINKDFQAISREAAEYELGEAKYYVVLFGIAAGFQMIFVGTLGLVFCISSLFAGILSATLLPFTEIAGVIFFKEKFTGEKGMALALCLWGFASYFYGSYKLNKKQATQEEEESK
ncbi:purine permease 1-like [Magnolia sinica]|uniref:purine permease 1-like n=1 Tax=Magnolia sinica TaxID=86752 RepID=UPI002657ADB8|nr:purine permease 1-like [Magnolia sinica]